MASSRLLVSPVKLKVQVKVMQNGALSKNCLKIGAALGAQAGQDMCQVFVLRKWAARAGFNIYSTTTVMLSKYHTIFLGLQGCPISVSYTHLTLPTTPYV